MFECGQHPGYTLLSVGLAARGVGWGVDAYPSKIKCLVQYQGGPFKPRVRHLYRKPDVLLIRNCHNCYPHPHPDIKVGFDRSPTIKRRVLFYSESQQWRPSALVAPIRKETPRPRKAKHSA